MAITAAITVLIITTNPMKFDWTQRITGGLALIFASYFFAHTVQIKNRNTTNATEERAVPKQFPARQSGPATTFGDHSPANTGDGNTFNDGATKTKKAREEK